MSLRRWRLQSRPKRSGHAGRDTEDHGIHADAVLLAEGLRLPTTSMGKVQRDQCRKQYLEGGR
jgi:hypothetical protein